MSKKKEDSNEDNHKKTLETTLILSMKVMYKIVKRQMI